MLSHGVRFVHGVQVARHPAPHRHPLLLRHPLPHCLAHQAPQGVCVSREGVEVCVCHGSGSRRGDMGVLPLLDALKNGTLSLLPPPPSMHPPNHFPPPAPHPPLSQIKKYARKNGTPPPPPRAPQDASEVDGKAARALVKLKQFREFYILVVSYIYFTRIIVYLLESTLPFHVIWLSNLGAWGCAAPRKLERARQTNHETLARAAANSTRCPADSPALSCPTHALTPPPRPLTPALQPPSSPPWHSTSRAASSLRRWRRAPTPTSSLTPTMWSCSHARSGMQRRSRPSRPPLFYRGWRL
jgi:hypothetical protein